MTDLEYDLQPTLPQKPSPSVYLHMQIYLLVIGMLSLGKRLRNIRSRSRHCQSPGSPPSRARWKTAQEMRTNIFAILDTWLWFRNELFGGLCLDSGRTDHCTPTGATWHDFHPGQPSNVGITLQSTRAAEETIRWPPHLASMNFVFINALAAGYMLTYSVDPHAAAMPLDDTDLRKVARSWLSPLTTIALHACIPCHLTLLFFGPFHCNLAEPELCMRQCMTSTDKPPSLQWS